MKIQINHIAKMEGHAGFVGRILDGNVAEAKFEIKEGARLIEGILLGRHFTDAPIITARICGICPVVHILNSIKAIEAIFKVKVSEPVLVLRKILKLAQIIHSHTLHLFFLSFPDFINEEETLKAASKYPRETQAALKIRDWANKIVQVVGGRTIHPIACEVGGFKKWPEKNELEKLLKEADTILAESLILGQLFKKLKYPKFERKTKFISLHHPREYAFYDGNIKVKSLKSEVKSYKTEEFYQKLKEQPMFNRLVKGVTYNDEPFMVGALARINNNYKQLNKEAKKLWQSRGLKVPVYNSFYNIWAQAVEVMHCIEECEKLLKKFLRLNLTRQRPSHKYKVRAGWGVGAIEAPRGTLYDYYKIDNKGFIRDCNIITPTAQFLINLEEDLKVYLPNLKKMSKTARRQKIRTLVRAYDPCISCATH